jgi:hypothetical protein
MRTDAAVMIARNFNHGRTLSSTQRRQPLASGRTQNANEKCNHPAEGPPIGENPDWQVAVRLLSGWGRHSSRSSAAIATRLFANRGDAPASAPVFQSARQPGYQLTERAVNFIVKEAAERAGVNPAASIHWLRHAHASHAIATVGSSL